MESRQVSFKEAVFTLKTDPAFNQIYALSPFRVTSHAELISEIIESISSKLPQSNRFLLSVLVYEIIIKNRNLSSENAVVKKLMALKPQIQQKFESQISGARAEKKIAEKTGLLPYSFKFESNFRGVGGCRSYAGGRPAYS